MKINKIELANFKKYIEHKEFEFNVSQPKDAVSDITLILGNNGSGKSSILQAVAIVTATASRENFTPDELDWPGFDYRSASTGRMPPTIKCHYTFHAEEIEAIAEYASELQEMGVKIHTPSQSENIRLSYSFDQRKSFASKGAADYFQFGGYQYAKRLSKVKPDKNILFERVGNIFWYTEQRTSYSISNILESEPTKQLDYIRRFLASAYTFHVAVRDQGRELKEGQFDFFNDFQQLYKRVFPDRSFVGSAPSFDKFEKSEAPDFFLSDGHNQYELAEMSAGERAIFPILMDFARWNINHSIIIIDEIELHLHPPLQQALVRALPKLGKNNQFIITSHSDSVASMFSEEQIIRL